MKTLLSCLTGIFTLVATCASGQPLKTFNWNTSFSPAWADGATFGFATNIDGTGVNAAVNITKTGGTWIRSLYTSGAMTPTKNGSYTVGTLAPPNNLMLALDYNNLLESITVDITFSRPVYSVAFSMGDIDRHFKNRNDFMDEVVVEANYKTAHPAFTKYMTDPNFPNQLQFSGDTVRVNPNGSLSGNAGPAGYPTTFDAAEQAGTVNVSFGTQLIYNLRIRYGSAVGSMVNPSIQAIAIGNISFRDALVLPAAVTFNAKQTGNDVLLQWDATNETAGSTYAVEYSRDGAAFTQLTTVPAQNKGAAAHYTYTHRATPTATLYYRLKTTESNGTFSYSGVQAIKGESGSFKITKLYSTLFTQQLSLQAEVPETGEALLCAYNANGELVNKTTYAVEKGTNNLVVNTPQNLASGTYLFCLRYKGDVLTVKAVKQ